MMSVLIMAFLRIEGLWSFLLNGFEPRDECRDALPPYFIEQVVYDCMFEVIVEAATTREVWECYEKIC